MRGRRCEKIYCRPSARWTRGCSALALCRPSLELQNCSSSFALSRQIEYGVDRSSALIAVMRAVGLIKPSRGTDSPEDGTTCCNVVMGSLPPFSR